VLRPPRPRASRQTGELRRWAAAAARRLTWTVIRAPGTCQWWRHSEVSDAAAAAAAVAETDDQRRWTSAHREADRSATDDSLLDINNINHRLASVGECNRRPLLNTSYSHSSVTHRRGAHLRNTTVWCSSLNDGLEPAVSLHHVLWTIDHTCNITFRHLSGLYTGNELKCSLTDEQECEQLAHRLLGC